jgi:hypothetical protein
MRKRAEIQEMLWSLRNCGTAVFLYIQFNGSILRESGVRFHGRHALHSLYLCDSCSSDPFCIAAALDTLYVTIFAKLIEHSRYCWTANAWAAFFDV